MQVSAVVQDMHERRSYKPERSALWDRLSMTQKFAASSLTQFGYELICIRREDTGNRAILMCGKNVATIDAQGEIDTSSSIIVRAV